MGSKCGDRTEQGQGEPAPVGRRGDKLIIKELPLTTFSTGLMAIILSCHCRLFNLVL